MIYLDSTNSKDVYGPQPKASHKPTQTTQGITTPTTQEITTPTTQEITTQTTREKTTQTTQEIAVPNGNVNGSDRVLTIVVWTISVTAIALLIVVVCLILSEHKKRLLRSNTIHSYLKETDFSAHTQYKMTKCRKDLLYHGMSEAEIDSITVGRPVAEANTLETLHKAVSHRTGYPSTAPFQQKSRSKVRAYSYQKAQHAIGNQNSMVLSAMKMMSKTSNFRGSILSSGHQNTLPPPQFSSHIPVSISSVSLNDSNTKGKKKKCGSPGSIAMKQIDSKCSVQAKMQKQRGSPGSVAMRNVPSSPPVVGSPMLGSVMSVAGKKLAEKPQSTKIQSRRRRIAKN